MNPIVHLYDSNDGPPRLRSFLPRRPGDVGHDLFALIDEQTLFDRIWSLVIGRRCCIVWPIVGQRTIASGLSLVMSDEVWCEIRPRSSTSRKKLEVLGGSIDSGYMGELFTVVHNLGLIPRIICEGERYAQVVFYPAVRPEIRPMNILEYRHAIARARIAGGRMADGFGSTGQ